MQQQQTPLQSSMAINNKSSPAIAVYNKC